MKFINPKLFVYISIYVYLYHDYHIYIYIQSVSYSLTHICFSSQSSSLAFHRLFFAGGSSAAPRAPKPKALVEMEKPLASLEHIGAVQGNTFPFNRWDFSGEDGTVD